MKLYDEHSGIALAVFAGFIVVVFGVIAFAIIGDPIIFAAMLFVGLAVSAVIAVAVSQSSKVRCRYCQEKIHAKATKCPRCQSPLS